MKKSKVKRIIALLLTFALVLGSIPADMLGTVLEVKAEPEKTPLLHYDFSGTSAEDGQLIEDVTGNGNDGVIRGNRAQISNGTLTLPGGDNGSDAAYVELPEGMFDGKDTLTISLWLKNDTGKGNYAAMFFGSKELVNGMPLHYWILNPCNLEQGALKTALTDEVAQDGMPYLHEAGFTTNKDSTGERIVGPTTDNNWGLYTTVITADTLTGYYNGENIGTVSLRRSASDFGSDLVSYIGKSLYPDKLYKGGVRDVKVYTDELTDEEVQAEYDQGIVNLDASELTMGGLDAVVEDLVLQDAGNYGSSITWETSDASVVEADGTIHRAPSEEGDKSAVLTATIAYGTPGASTTKEFPVTVKAQAELTKEESLLLHYEFADGTATDGSTVADTSGNGNDGTIHGKNAGITDGTLTLPGGANGSGAAYVQMPTGMFDGRNTLTISFWLKNETKNGDYAAMFFGTTENYPRQYWLFNPCNPAGLMKSVVTNGNSSSPWTTEYGISPTNASQGIAGPATGENWTYYSTVITKDSITGYYNGVKVGTVETNRPVSQFGSNLAGYIGRSSYPDKYYKGGVKDVRVYTKALTEDEIIEDYSETADESIILEMLNKDKEALTLPTTEIRGDISLPNAGSVYKSSITWESDKTEYITNDGKVNRPSDQDVNVTLTATLTLKGQSVTKEFPLTVKYNNPEGDLVAAVKDLSIGTYYVTKDLTLPAAAANGATVTWTSDSPDYIGDDGKVTRPEDGDKNVTLKAEITLGDVTAHKDFPAVVLQKPYGYLLSYTGSKDKKGFSDTSSENKAALANSLHMGYSQDGSTYSALNYDSGICFTDNKDALNGILSPYLFRKADGSYAFAATNNNNYSYIYVFDSEDLLLFNNESKLDLNTDKKVLEPVCEWDGEKYIITWTDGEKTYQNTSADLKTASAPVEIQGRDKERVEAAIPDGANAGNVLEVNQEEYDRVVKKLAPVVNTGVSSLPSSVTVQAEEGKLPDTVQSVDASYSDGSNAEIPVTWDDSSVNYKQDGSYTVTGKVGYPEYDNPFIESKADPWITKGDDGYYYFTASYPMNGGGDSNGYSRVTLRRAKTIKGLQTAEEVSIWNWSAAEGVYRYIWAPEIHQINGRWYVFFTGSVEKNNAFGIRPHILVCKEGGNPMDPASWSVQRMEASSGDALSFTNFSLDMTHFEAGGQHYVIWAQSVGNSSLLIATIDPDEPWKLTSEPQVLTVPEYAWERIRFNVDEGPSVLKRDGKVYMCFSAAGTGAEYCIGMMTADENADLLDLDNWTKTPYPVLNSADVTGEYGPGHNSFTTDEYGNDIFVYHARSTTTVNGDPLYDPGRHARIKTVHWAADGTPILKMTADQAVDPQYQEVTMTVKVEGNKEEPDPDIIAKYDFSDGVKDVSGHGNNGKVVGNVTVQDGVLTLPGATASQNTNYVELPGSMFAGQNTLTVDLWVKNELDPNNYAAMFFGTKEELPVSYWLLNPSNPAGNMKTVFTNTVDEEKPYLTEVGISPSDSTKGIAGPSTKSLKGQWVKYTTVITEDGITGYMNGEKVGTVPLDRKVSDFGSDLAAYLGKSSYPDPIFKGSFKDITIYNKALTDEEIEKSYLEGLSDEESVRRAAEEYVVEGIDNGIITGDLGLLTRDDKYNVGIKWVSGNPIYVTNAGKVVGNVKEKTQIKVTATFSKGEASLEKVYEAYLLPAGTTDYSMDIDGNNIGVDINDRLVGLFFEDINNSADGGLNPEMVKNNSFENYRYDRGSRVNDYKNMWNCDAEDKFAVASENPLNGNNPNYAVLTGDLTLTNNGYTPINSLGTPSMAVKEGVDMNFSVFTKADPSYTGVMKVKLQNAAGEALTDEITVQPAKTGEWAKVTGKLTGKATEKGQLVFKVEGAGAGELSVDMISVSPQDTFGYGDTNYGHGAGLRADLVQKIADINPGFIRFPGGCIIEGAYEWDTYYDWENTIGPLEERKQIPNLWGNDATYGYMQSYGFGYHEILSLCEEIGAEAYPILNAGVLCQARSNNIPAATGELLDQFVKDATDLLDYCWGDPSTNEMAAKRAQNGHEETFDLKYVGIGNENWDDKYFKNFDIIYDRVMEYKEANYPDRELTVIAASGTAADDGNNQKAWNWLKQNHAGDNILVDEHYYVGTNFSQRQDDRYDYFLREEEGGLPVFLGEYATHVGVPNSMESALSDAAYMTGIERNSDIVKNVSYAPLFNKMGSTNWQTDLIWFDEYNSIGSINYYVQQMFSRYTGDQTIKALLDRQGERYTVNTGSPVLATYATKGYVESVKVTREDGTVLLDETFEDDSETLDLWEKFPGSGGSFEIRDGKLYLSQASATNGVWIPSVVNDPEWYNYKVEAVVVKESGNEGFMVGAGATSGSDYYWYNMGGWSDSRNCVQRSRTNSDGNVISNDHEWYNSSYYSSPGYTKFPVNEAVTVSFNYGINERLEAGYTSASVTRYAEDYSMNLRPYHNDIYNTVSKDDDYVYVKLVNTESGNKQITLNLSNLNITGSEASVISLKGDSLNAVNTMDNEGITPQKSSVSIAGSKVVYKVPGYSVNVIMIPLSGQGPVDPVEIKVNPSQAEVAEGGSVALTATGNYEGSLTWSSSDDAIAVVDQSGKVTGVKEGTVTITAADSKGNKGTAEVTVTREPEEPVEIKLDPAKAIVPAGSSLTITAAGNYEGSLTWSSSNEKVAAVDQNGKVTGIKEGKAIITAADSKGNEGSAEVTVTKKLQPHWVAENGKWKYDNGDGTFAVNCWKQIRGQWYYFDGDGYMKTGWIFTGGQWYYLNRDGIMETGWVYAGSAWYYLKDNGAMATGWLLDGSTWYYLKSSGAMATGWLLDGKTWYYLKSSGAMATGWLLDGKTWYYLKSSGAMATGWLLDGKTWYYLKGNGAMATGWLLDGKTWYYLKGSGAMATGWLLDGKTWYYLKDNGAMATGWIQVGKKWYYLRSNGAMASSTWIGKYYVNGSGVWTKTR